MMISTSATETISSSRVKPALRRWRMNWGKTGRMVRFRWVVGSNLRQPGGSAAGVRGIRSSVDRHIAAVRSDALIGAGVISVDDAAPDDKSGGGRPVWRLHGRGFEIVAGRQFPPLPRGIGRA